MSSQDVKIAVCSRIFCWPTFQNDDPAIKPKQKFYVRIKIEIAASNTNIQPGKNTTVYILIRLHKDHRHSTVNFSFTFYNLKTKLSKNWWIYVYKVLKTFQESLIFLHQLYQIGLLICQWKVKIALENTLRRRGWKKGWG